MRDFQSKSSFSLRALLLAAVAVAAMLPAAPVRAEDEEETIDNKIFRELLEGIGLRERERNIDYSERSPLVVPPTISALPAPAPAGAQASVPPNWPVDQDVKRAKEAKAAEKKSRYRRADSAAAEEDRPLTPDKLAPGTGSRRQDPSSDMRNGDPYNRQTAENAARAEKPSALGYMGNLFSDAFGSKGSETVVFRGEPPRESLTEPPPGYQTPSPNQPYGLTGKVALPQAQGKAMEASR